MSDHNHVHSERRSDWLTLDTSGAVMLPPGFIWRDLSPFAQGYVEAMFASGEFGLPHGGSIHPSWHKLGFSDLAPETLSLILADCAFIDAKGTGGNSVIAHQAGGYFWRERNSAGGYGGFPPLTVTLGDDGRVYLREPPQ